MLTAFLYDYKKEIRRDLALEKYSSSQKIIFAAVGLSMILYIASAIFACFCLFIISAAMLAVSLIVARFKFTKETKKSEGESDSEKSISCVQTKWFRKKRVDIVKKMLDFNNTGLAPAQCIDLLLSECDSKLKLTRPSEVIKKRLKPLIIPITIVILSLITAWLNIMLPATNISFDGSFSQHILSVMKVLATDIVHSKTIMTYFVTICVYATVIYLAVAFIILPAIMSVADRDFLVTTELREVLLYLKHDASFAKQEVTCEPGT